MPEKYRAGTQAWQKVHPDWQYRFWDRDSILAEAQAHFPDLVPELRDETSSLALIERCDVGRLVVLAVHGGVYSDLDYVPKKRHDPLLEAFDADREADCAMARELAHHTNCWIAAKPGSRFLTQYAIPLIQSRFRPDWGVLNIVPRIGHLMTLWKTGPEAIEDAICIGRESFKLFHSLPAATLFEEYGTHTVDSSWVSGITELERGLARNVPKMYDAVETRAVEARRDYVEWSKAHPVGRNALMFGVGTAVGMVVGISTWQATILGVLVLYAAFTLDRLLFSVEKMPGNRMPSIVPLVFGYVLGIAVLRYASCSGSCSTAAATAAS
jgi:hypothetical protein